MAVVELRPGDTLSIIWSSVQETAFGQKEVESSLACSYEELLQRLKSKNKTGISRRSGSAGTKFSRVVSLSVNAIKKGHWSNNAEIDRNKVFESLIANFEHLDPSQYENITSSAHKSLTSLYQSKTPLKPAQRSELKKWLEIMGVIDEK